MPFDGVQLGHARLTKLSRLLRTGEFPASFTWDFEKYKEKTDCGTVGCALGLAHMIWPNDFRSLTRVEFFGTTYETDTKLFFNTNNFYGKLDAAVTPVDVADAIDRYLAGAM